MRWLRPVLAVWFTVALFLAGGAVGQTFCTEREDLLNRLASKWGEELVEVKDFGLYGLLEVLVSPATGSWTLLLTQPTGVSCVLATGDGLNPSNYFLEQTEQTL